jgi:uncharacterized membrane protein (UPF0182 family)
VSFEMPESSERSRRPQRPARRSRSRVLTPTIIVVGVLVSLFGAFAGFYTDMLWFREVGFLQVFTTELLTKVVLFLIFGVLLGAVVAANFVVAYRTRPAYMPASPGQQELDRYRTTIDPYKRYIVLGAAVLLGLLTGSSAAGAWRTFLTWRNSTPFGVVDAQFGVDVAFFAFALPWWRFVLGFGFAAVVLSLIASAATHYLYGGLRPQASGDRTSPAARAHLSVLLGLFVLLQALDYWLDRYSLATEQNSRIVGLQFTDVTAVLPGKTILAVISVICAGLFFANVVRRTWLLPGVGVGLLVLSAVLVGGVYPAIVQRLQVAPNEPQAEAPYIARNIEATRAAYGIDDVQIETYDVTTDATAGQLAQDEIVANVRLLDPSLLSPTYRNLQQIEQYYDFASTLDIDRYDVDGETRDVVVAVREVNLEDVPAAQRNWANDHLTFTHGFGFVAALGDTRLPDGQPDFISSNIPPRGELGEFQPRIYFGESAPEYSIVGQPEGAPPLELDFPDDSAPGGQRNNTYAGAGGVPISSLWHRLLFATTYQEPNILLSGRINENSRILYDRDPQERVQRVAPWLTLDGDAYPAVVGDKILWVVDGYTTTNSYPYSSRTVLDATTTTSLTTQQNRVLAPVDQVNYLRNSVKATVDAYDGTVTLYAWDDADPVLQTWMKAFPDTVQPRDAISADLEEHLRYPQDMFKVQREQLARYHVTDPAIFYNGGDFWRVPDDPTRGGDNAEAQPPYYLTLQMPDQDEPSFSLTTSFVPFAEDRQNLLAFMSVDADPGPDYGAMRVLELPQGLQINGPQQVQNAFSSNDQVAQTVNVLELGNSEVLFGNLLTLPVGDGLLYVEPVYVQATGGTGFPLLRKVLVSFGDQVAFEDTLELALDRIFGGDAGTDTEEPDVVEPVPGEEPAEPEDPASPAPTPTPTPTDTAAPVDPEAPPVEPADPDALAQALADLQQAYDDGQAALQAGDFAAYGEAQERLRDALARAIAAEDGLPAPTPAP